MFHSNSSCQGLNLDFHCVRDQSYSQFYVLQSIKLSVTLYPFANCALNTDVKRTITVTKKVLNTHLQLALKFLHCTCLTLAILLTAYKKLTNQHQVFSLSLMAFSFYLDLSNHPHTFFMILP